MVGGSIRRGGGFPVYLTAVLEHLCAEILETAGVTAQDHRAVRITNRFLFLAIRGDEDLHPLLSLKLGFEFPGCGAFPYIEPELVKKTPKSKKRKPPVGEAADDGDDGDDDGDEGDDGDDGDDADGGVGPVQRARRFRAGTKALMSIRRFQKTTDPLLALAIVRRAFKAMAEGPLSFEGLLLAEGVPELVRTALEAYLIEMLNHAQRAAIHAGRVRVQAGDLSFALWHSVLSSPLHDGLGECSPFTDGAFGNLCYRAGIKTHAGDLAPKCRELAAGFLETLALHLTGLLSLRRRKKATLEETVRALKLATGKTWLVAGADPNAYAAML